MYGSAAVQLDTAIDLARGLLRLPDSVQCTIERAGSGKFSETFFVTVEAECEYVLRVAPPDGLLQLFYEYRMMRQEPALHRLIQSRTSVTVPQILAHDFSRQVIDRDYLVMNRLPGEPLSELSYGMYPVELYDVLRELGRQVAMLHAIPIGRYGYRGAHRPMPSQRRWDDAFAIMWEKMLDDCANCGYYTADDHALGMSLLKAYRQVFDPYPIAGLCHMDLWVANVLVDKGRFSGLFDFDRACFGDIENEFAVAEYCGLTTAAFWEGYGRRPPATEESRIRRWFYMLYEHQKYIVISASARRNDPARAKRYADQSLQSMHNFQRSGRPEF